MPEFQSVAVLTGGASGIGLGIARHLLAEGRSVVIADVNAHACSEAASALDEHIERLRVVPCDIGTAEGAEEAVGTAIKEFGQIDILCNNAAVHPLARIEDQTIQSWRDTFRVNLDGSFLCSQCALPYMKARRTGAIINIGSVSGLAPYATGGAYAASKAALIMLTKVLALEVGMEGITVNCICPGSIRHRAEDLARELSPNIPVGHAGTPVDVAHLVSYLASEHARYMTGTVLVLDGGATAGRVRAR